MDKKSLTQQIDEYLNEFGDKPNYLLLTLVISDSNASEQEKNHCVNMVRLHMVAKYNLAGTFDLSGSGVNWKYLDVLQNHISKNERPNYTWYEMIVLTDTRINEVTRRCALSKLKEDMEVRYGIKDNQEFFNELAKVTERKF